MKVQLDIGHHIATTAFTVSETVTFPEFLARAEGLGFTADQVLALRAGRWVQAPSSCNLVNIARPE